MSGRPPSRAARLWRAIPAQLLPFADAVEGLPLGRLLRLALIQVSVGMALTLLNGTLNRVMIVEIGIPAWQVAVFIALPLLMAPVRALFGFKSDTHKSALGWRRVPYIWMGTMALFGGLALVPMSLLLMSGMSPNPNAPLAGHLGALLAFFLMGVGVHMTQTAGLALACDMAPAERRPRVVALLYVALLLAMVVSAFTFGAVLDVFTPEKLFEAVSGAAMVAATLNIFALWKQEGRNSAPAAETASVSIAQAWRAFDRNGGGKARRLLVAVALVTAGFNMQDVLLEPYGGEVLHLSVGATTMLTAIWAMGSLGGFWLAARRLRAGVDPFLCAAQGVLIGIPGFAAVIFSGPLQMPDLFRAGAMLIGFGGGLASVSLLSAATSLAEEARFGFAIGAWGSAQALSAGIAMATGGALRDAARGLLPATINRPDEAYAIVYHLEIALLFGALIALGPLASRSRRAGRRLAMPEFPA